MHLVLLCHPPALGSASMPRFARFIGEGMAERGHTVEYWTSPAKCSAFPKLQGNIRKWLGYVDQYLLFPPILRKRLRKAQRDWLIVVTDQALGMWVPFVKSLPHAVHCHDFLAERSGRGEFVENPTRLTGRCYQKLIRRGYQQARNFICVSHKTMEDLRRFLAMPPQRSEVLHNGLNYPFSPLERKSALRRLENVLPDHAQRGYVLHVGGDQWYKNRTGVMAIYCEYARHFADPLPLLMVGSKPSPTLQKLAAECNGNGTIHFLPGISDAMLHAAYCAADVLLFPSLEEGFGWPIVEAQACGCLVLTTGHAPMTEVGGNAAFYLPRRPAGSSTTCKAWAAECAQTLENVLSMPPSARLDKISAGLANAARFDSRTILDRLEALYAQIIANP